MLPGAHHAPLRITAAFALGLAAWFAPIPPPWRAPAFLLPYLLAGGDVLLTATRHIRRGLLFDEMTLMATATLGAFALRQYAEAVAVMVFYQCGEFLQNLAVGKSRRSLAALLAIRPDTATLLRNGREITTTPDALSPGDLLLVRPGERIPVDGEIIAGRTAIDPSALTGESLPRDLGPGDPVYAGTHNLSAPIQIRALRCAGESTAARILHLVKTAEAQNAPAERFVTRFARRYTPCVVLTAALLAIAPPLLFAQPWTHWIHRALVFLVVSCPCALVVSIPLAFFSGIGRASHNGILLKSANTLETLAAVRAIAFDKTGTITRGVFTVSAVHPASVSPARLLDIAAALEHNSTHPVAQSILAAHRGHILPTQITNVRECPGLGIQAHIDGRPYSVGNTTLMDRVGAHWHDCHLGGAVIHLAQDPDYLGHITIQDQLKPEAPAAIDALTALGITTLEMFTGDAARTARPVADSAHIPTCHADLLPDRKIACLENLMARHRPVAFVGDGINDAPVLARADVGIAMGALGTEAAIETADVVIMDDRLDRLPQALQIARRTLHIVRQNILLILAVKLALLLLGALGLITMWAAVLGDVGILILAILNATRALLPPPRILPCPPPSQ